MTVFILATLVLAGAPGGTVPAADAPGGVPPARLEKLTQGINLSHWFSQSHSYSKEHLETYNTAKDAALIKAIGFRHVRFTFNEATVVDKEKPAVLNPEKMKRFETAIDMLLAAGLAVIVDFHPEEDYKRAVEKDAAAIENFVGMWRALARHLSSRDPERIFFEVMNEPVMRDSARWNVIQKKVLAAMRESAPRHTLIAAAAEWSEIYKLEFVEVVADRNVVYNFHCYEPFKFTHQGATWAGPTVKGLKNVPYPSSPAAVAKVLADLPDEKTRQLMIQYGKETWNAEKIDALIARAAAWGRKHGAALTCNEFGVYRVAPAADRNRCIEDVRNACEKHGIGWCMWDYAGAFGVATGKPGRRVPDADTVKALGLTASAQEPPGHFVTSSAVNDIEMWQPSGRHANLPAGCRDSPRIDRRQGRTPLKVLGDRPRLLLRVHFDNVLCARIGRNLQLLQFAVAVDALDDRVAGGVELERDVPLLGPGGQKEQAVAIRLQQHELQRGEDVVAVVLIGNPVEVRPPHDREAIAGIDLGGAGGD